MLKPLECILLVDDDKMTNFFNQKIIEKSGLNVRVVVCENGEEALDFLKSTGEYEGDKIPAPGIVFLDINMPVLDGWQFLEEYKDLSPQMKADVVVAMLTTSLNPDDKTRALEINNVKDFFTKPLSQEKIEKIVKAHWPEMRL